LKKTLFTLIIILVCFKLFAQTSPLKDTTIVVKTIGFVEITKNPYKDSIKNSRRLRIIPVALVAYNPELKFVIGAGGLISYKSNPLDSIIKPSVFPFNILYSTSNSYLFRGLYSTYFSDDKFRINGELSVKNMSDNYWGVGYSAGKSISKPDTSTVFRKKWYIFNPTILYRFKKSLYAGVKLNISHTQVTEGSFFFFNDENIKRYGTDIFNIGLGAVVNYDTRDYPENAKSGTYLGLTLEGFSENMGSSYSYSVFVVDYRYYHKFLSNNGILAWQLKTRYCLGDTPWSEMSKLGSEYGLRGYHSSRYRDKFMALGQIEYRYMFPVKRRPNRRLFNRHGFAVWVGGGTIAPSMVDVSKFLPNAGFGYRLELLNNINARFDIGFSNDGNSMYFTINESF